MFGTGDRPPRGWTIDSGRLEEVSTVAGYAARRCEVRGHCMRRDCRRTCHFDFEMMILRGMALLRVDEVKRTFRCGRLDGCALEFQDKPEFPLALGELMRRDYVGVEIRCSQCGQTHITSIEGMIGRLKASGQGGPATKVREVAGLLRGPCGKCKAAKWNVAILWYDPTGKTPLWKQDLQKRRDTARRIRAEQPGPSP